MSSSRDSSLSFLPEYLQQSLVFDDPVKARLHTALQLAADPTNTEHHTARCVILLVSLIFQSLHWNMVPQFYTDAGKLPDLVIERFHLRPEKHREALFIGNVFMEFKRRGSPDDPIKQLEKAIQLQHGQTYRSKGLLIGVKGVEWRFVEYNFVTVPHRTGPALLLRDFYDFTKGPAQNADRPTASRIYAQGDYMNLESKKEGEDVIRALLWISKGKDSRDLSFLVHHSSVLPQSFTHSSFVNGIVGEPDADNPHQLGNQFDYLIPLIESGMEPFQDQAGGQSQE